jgi:hypothetical protein
MKRMLLLVTVAAPMAVMLMLGVLPVLDVANENESSKEYR